MTPTGKSAWKIRLAVMDLWKPFRNVTREFAPRAAILFDKFHILRRLSETMCGEIEPTSRLSRRRIARQIYK